MDDLPLPTTSKTPLIAFLDKMERPKPTKNIVPVRQNPKLIQKKKANSNQIDMFRFPIGKPLYPSKESLMAEFGVPDYYDTAKDTFPSVHMINQRIERLQVLRGESKYLDLAKVKDGVKVQQIELSIAKLQEKMKKDIEYRAQIQNTIETLCQEIATLQDQCGVTLVETGEDDEEVM